MSSFFTSNTFKNTQLILCSLVFSFSVTACVTVTEGKRVVKPEQAAAAYSALAAEYIKKKNLDAAERNAQKAIDVKSDYAPGYNMMAIVLQRDGSPENVQKAEGYFKKAIRYKKDYASAHNNYGVYLSQLKRYDDAMTQFAIAGSMLGYTGRAASLENLGKTALLANNITKAEQAFKRAISINSNSVVAKMELVDIYLQQQKYDEADLLYRSYINFLGNRKLSSRSLLSGIVLASHAQDFTEFRRLSSLLKDDYPYSQEMQRFRRLFPSE